MKLFVTGGTGFIGSHFLNAIANHDYYVKALRRKGSKSRIALTREPEWIYKSMDQVDVSDMEGMDALVHFAATGVSPQQAEWRELIDGNVSALIDILHIAAKASVGKVIIAGTSAEYGLSANEYDYIPTHPRHCDLSMLTQHRKRAHS